MQSKCEGRVLLRAAADSGEGVKPWGVSSGIFMTHLDAHLGNLLRGTCFGGMDPIISVYLMKLEAGPFLCLGSRL